MFNMIKVTDRFYINSDSSCYKLQEKTIIKDETSKNYRQEVFRDLGYYTTIEQCLDGIMKTQLREYISKDVENSLKDLQQEINKIREYFKSLKLDI